MILVIPNRSGRAESKHLAIVSEDRVGGDSRLRVRQVAARDFPFLGRQKNLQKILAFYFLLN